MSASLDKCFGCHLLQALRQRRLLNGRRRPRDGNHWHGTDLGLDNLQSQAAQVLGTAVRRRGGCRGSLVHQNPGLGLNGYAGRGGSRHTGRGRGTGQEGHVHQLLHRFRRVLRLVNLCGSIAVDQGSRGQGVTLVVLHVGWRCLQRDASHNHVGRGYGSRAGQEAGYGRGRLLAIMDDRQAEELSPGAAAALLQLNVVAVLREVLLLAGVVVGAPGSQALLQNFKDLKKGKIDGLFRFRNPLTLLPLSVIFSALLAFRQSTL